jgi:hypothetical protein
MEGTNTDQPVTVTERKKPEAKTVTLPSGVVAVIGIFKGRHISQAQKIVGSDTEKYLFALIAITTLFDGKAVTMEEVEDMDGWDCLKLMGIFSDKGDAK